MASVITLQRRPDCSIISARAMCRARSGSCRCISEICRATSSSDRRFRSAAPACREHADLHRARRRSTSAYAAFGISGEPSPTPLGPRQSDRPLPDAPASPDGTGGDAAPAAIKVSALVGNAIDGGSTDHRRRWGITVHNSHYGLVQDNVALQLRRRAAHNRGRLARASNVIDHNFAVRSRGRRRAPSATAARIRASGSAARTTTSRNNVAGQFRRRRCGRDRTAAVASAAARLRADADGQGSGHGGVTLRATATRCRFWSSATTRSTASQGGLTCWWVSSQDPIAAASPIERVQGPQDLARLRRPASATRSSARVTLGGLHDHLGIERTRPCGVAAAAGFHGEDYAATDITHRRRRTSEGMDAGIRWSAPALGLQVVERSTLHNDIDMVVRTMLLGRHGPGWLPPRTVIANNVRFQGRRRSRWTGTSPASRTPRSETACSSSTTTASHPTTSRFTTTSRRPRTSRAACRRARTTASEIDGVARATAASGGPIVPWVGPFQGPAAGGTAVKLKSGANFLSGATVTFGTTASREHRRHQPERHHGDRAAARAAGTVGVTLTNPNGQSFTFKNGFRFETGGCTLRRLANNAADVAACAAADHRRQ